MISELVPFRARHLDLMDLRAGQYVCSANSNVDLYEDMGPCFTLFIDNKPVCAAGIVNSMPKVGECWLIASKDFEKNYVIIAKAINRFLDSMDYFYHRLQMSVKTDFAKACRFAEFLGFQQEGVMRQLDVDKNDYFLYSRIK
jgi:hypothetical protein